MSARLVLLVCIALGLQALPRPARAWSAEGHFLIGAVADRLIAGTAAARAVAGLLGEETLETASVWSDCVRGARREGGTFRYTVSERYPECRPFESAEGQREMVRYVERNWTQCRPGPTDGLCHDQYHYANIAVQRRAYARGITGSSGHDIVGAIDAATAVLRGKPAPPPFDLDRREALRVLVHSVGDVHQPVHLASLYLDASGRRIDPDRRGVTVTPKNHTLGANRIKVGNRNLHSMWDGVPRALRRDAFLDEATAEARRVPPTAGGATGWAARWATESLLQGRRGFEGLRIGAQDARGDWSAELPPDSDARREAIQREQLVRAGARLAQLLREIYPEG
jgi:hypothetical protein